MFSRRFVFVAVAASAIVLGCSDAMSPDQYGHVWREEVAKYRAIDKNPADTADDREAESGRATEIARQIRAIADEMKDWKAPDQFAELQDETYIFYRGQADAYSGYAQALGTSDDGKIEAAANGINSFAGEQQQKIATTISNLKSGKDQFDSSWSQVLRDSPKKAGT